jgi:cytidylate kinase
MEIIMNTLNKSNLIINIGRQVGSGGLEIGKLLAKMLHIEFYDKALMELAAKESGLDSKHFEKADEKPSIISSLHLHIIYSDLTTKPY